MELHSLIKPLASCIRIAKDFSRSTNPPLGSLPLFRPVLKRGGDVFALFTDCDLALFPSAGAVLLRLEDPNKFTFYKFS